MRRVDEILKGPELQSSSEKQLPQAIVLYHYFPPDDVVSAIIFGELSAGLVSRGWDVQAFPCNRSFRDEKQQYLAEEDVNGVKVRRIWRPGLVQSSGVGRILNAIWMIARWSALGLKPSVNPDVLIIGTDPIMSVLVAIVWRRFKPKTTIAHWCFDLYPEAAISAGIFKEQSTIVSLLRYLLKKSYAACDLIVDIGSCMRERLENYGIRKARATLVPWALAEPPEAVPTHGCERRTIFGETKLALMYSGSIGQAHSFDGLIELAQVLSGDDVKFAFSANGNGEKGLRQALSANAQNVVIIPPATVAKLSVRLSAADILVVSLKEDWTGTVVPSKFFGALAIGRPVLFCGSPESAIARWIREFEVGWVLAPGMADAVAEDLRRFMTNPEKMREMFNHCHQVYSKHFASVVTIDCWDMQLRNLIQHDDILISQSYTSY